MFKLKQTGLNEATDFLGCVISKTQRGDYTLSQVKYAEKNLLKHAATVRVKPTPLPPSYENLMQQMNRLKPEPTLNQKRYQEKLGSLGYLRATRPDLLHGLHQLAKFSIKPTKLAEKCMQHLFGYLKGSVAQVRTFYHRETDKTVDGSRKLVALVDAAFSNNPFKKYSTSGFFMYYQVTMVTANSSTQKKIATSAPEAELYEIFRTAKVMLYIKGLLQDMGEPTMALPF